MAFNNKPSSSGQFTNLQKYLGANKNFGQAQGGLAGKISGNINKSAQKTQKDIAGAQTAFGQQANQSAGMFRDDSGPIKNELAGVMRPQNDLNQQHTMGPESLEGAQGTGRTTQPAPQMTNLMSMLQNNAGNLTEEQMAKLTAMRDAQYSGPKSLMDVQGANNFGNLSMGATNVASQANQTRSEAGRVGLLQQMFNRQGYTGGQQKLDNLMLQGQKGAMDQLQGTRRAAAQTGAALTGAQKASGQMGQALTQEAQKTQGDTRKALTDTTATTMGNMNTQLADAQKAQDDETKRLSDALKSGNISQADYDKYLKGNINDGMNYRGIDPSKFITKGNLSAQTLAKEGDYNKLANLNKLGGGIVDTKTKDFLNSFNDKTKAGSYDPSNPLSFKGAEFKDAVSQANAKYDQGKAAYDKAMEQAQNTINWANKYFSEDGKERGQEAIAGAQAMMAQAQQAWDDARAGLGDVKDASGNWSTASRTLDVGGKAAQAAQEAKAAGTAAVNDIQSGSKNFPKLKSMTNSGKAPAPAQPVYNQSNMSWSNPPENMTDAQAQQWAQEQEKQAAAEAAAAQKARNDAWWGRG